MVGYGPWVQDPDYAEFQTRSTANVTHYTQTIAEAGTTTAYQDPVYPITVDDMEAAFETAQGELDHKGGWIDTFGTAYALSFPNWQSKWGVNIWRRVFHIGGWEHLYNPPNHGFLAPAGAIGIDYENQPYNPEDPWAFAAADTQTFQLGTESKYEGQFEDARVLGGQVLPWEVATQLYVTVPGEDPVMIDEEESPPTSTSPNWLVRNFDEAIDMAPFGATESDAWVADLHTATVVPILGGDPGPYGSITTSYGWILDSVRLNVTIRPPLYRWVYASEPYRRNYPRDDGLAGGARRNYPPSKAMQSGNRNAGGYL